MRPVKLGPPDVVVEQRGDGAIILRSPHPLRALCQKPDRTPGVLGEHGARPHFHCPAQRNWRRLAHNDLRANTGVGSRYRSIAAGARSFAGAANRNSLRQRHRACVARPRRDACRHSLRADLSSLLADVAGFRQAEIHYRNSHAGAGLCGERDCFRARNCGNSAGRCRSRRYRQSVSGAKSHAIRRAFGDSTERCRRCRSRQGRSRHDREIPVHIGLDRPAEGRDQHPAHALLQPVHDQRRPRLHSRRTAGAGRLAAMEPYVRRQSRFRHGARQRRFVLHRRRQAAAGRHRGDRAQPARHRTDDLPQRSQGL